LVYVISINYEAFYEWFRNVIIALLKF
jgi:hypothetical protein